MNARPFFALLAVGILPFFAAGVFGSALAQTGDDEPALVRSAQAAIAAKNWSDAEVAARKLVARSPRWDYLELLGDTQFGNADYQEALDSYSRAWTAAQMPTVSPAPTKAALGSLLTRMGNAYLRLKRTDEAIAAYTKAAPLAANPGLAYFNLCAVLYNFDHTDGLLAACNTAIAADPGRADAYFIKGSFLISHSTVKGGKTIAPPGAVEALQKYLDLAPNGPHAKDVRDMLDYVK
jgi:tetratricopeptide (TPR) repeat protein